MRILISLLLGASLAGLANAEALRLSEPVTVTDDYEVFGAPLDSEAVGMALGDLLAKASEHEGQMVRVTTRVAKVCQKKGCFFIAQDGAAQARVTFADYGFFVPTDTGGKQVTLVGTFSSETLSADQAAHYAEDLGEGAAGTVAGLEYRIVATSVMVPKG